MTNSLQINSELNPIINLSGEANTVINLEGEIEPNINLNGEVSIGYGTGRAISNIILSEIIKNSGFNNCQVYLEEDIYKFKDIAGNEMTIDYFPIDAYYGEYTAEWLNEFFNNSLIFNENEDINFNNLDSPLNSTNITGVLSSHLSGNNNKKRNLIYEIAIEIDRLNLNLSNNKFITSCQLGTALHKVKEEIDSNQNSIDEVHGLSNMEIENLISSQI